MDVAGVPSAIGSPRRPRVVDLATVLAILAAVVNAGIGVLLVASVSATGVQVAPGLLVVVVGISFLYAIAIALFAVLFRLGRTWARTVLISLSALSLLTLFAPNAYNIAVILLLLLAVVLDYRRPVSEWVRALRAG